MARSRLASAASSLLTACSVAEAMPPQSPWAAPAQPDFASALDRTRRRIKRLRDGMLPMLEAGLPDRASVGRQQRLREPAPNDTPRISTGWIVIPFRTLDD